MDNITVCIFKDNFILRLFIRKDFLLDLPINLINCLLSKQKNRRGVGRIPILDVAYTPYTKTNYVK
ncbi:hypothetical protein FACS1894132_02820 [Clostridia bacterium]|nr:hypothetical protein FACS1894132_02820 [Clostridia bacterium]